MEQVYPLQEDIVSQYCGMPVYIVMKDGTRHVGLLTRCEGGKLTLNGEPHATSAAELEAAPAKSSKKSKKSGSKSAAKSQSPMKSQMQSQAKSSKPEPDVQTQSYPFDPYYYEPRPYIPFRDIITLDFALIAFLFLLF